MTYTAAPQSELAKSAGTRVPRRSLLPHEADRVVTAGRWIDADPLALPSVHVIGACTTTDSAAAHPCDLAGSGLFTRSTWQRCASTSAKTWKEQILFSSTKRSLRNRRI
jgi:hypothetical protein